MSTQQVMDIDEETDNEAGPSQAAAEASGGRTSPTSLSAAVSQSRPASHSPVTLQCTLVDSSTRTDSIEKSLPVMKVINTIECSPPVEYSVSSCPEPVCDQLSQEPSTTASPNTSSHEATSSACSVLASDVVIVSPKLNHNSPSDVRQTAKPRVIDVALPIDNTDSALLDPSLGAARSSRSHDPPFHSQDMLHTPSPDYHQLTNLHMPIYDTLPVLQLKEETLMQQNSPSLFGEHAGNNKGPLPSLSSFSKHQQHQTYSNTTCSKGVQSSDMMLGDFQSEKVQVLPMYSGHHHDMYHSPLAMYDDADDTATMTTVDMATLRDHPSDTSPQYVLNSPEQQRSLHIIPDGHGKPYLVTINDENAAPPAVPYPRKPRVYRRKTRSSTGAAAQGPTHRQSPREGVGFRSPPAKYSRKSVPPSSFGYQPRASRPDNKENGPQLTMSGSGLQVLSTWRVNKSPASNRHKVTRLGQHQGAGDASTPYPPASMKVGGVVPSVGSPPGASCGKYLSPYTSGPGQMCGETGGAAYAAGSDLIPLSNIANKQQYLTSATSVAPVSPASTVSEDSDLMPVEHLGRHLLPPAAPYNTPEEADDHSVTSPNELLPTAGQLNAALYRAKETLSDSEYDIGRQTHNAKERLRRARIKLACEHLRDLIPGMTNKTDKATVFEFASQYITFLKRYVGGQHDKEFLRQCSPY